MPWLIPKIIIHRLKSRLNLAWVYYRSGLGWNHCSLHIQMIPASESASDWHFGLTMWPQRCHLVTTPKFCKIIIAQCKFPADDRIQPLLEILMAQTCCCCAYRHGWAIIFKHGTLIYTFVLQRTRSHQLTFSPLVVNFSVVMAEQIMMLTKLYI